MSSVEQKMPLLIAHIDCTHPYRRRADAMGIRPTTIGEQSCYHVRSSYGALR